MYEKERNNFECHGNFVIDSFDCVRLSILEYRNILLRHWYWLNPFYHYSLGGSKI